MDVDYPNLARDVENGSFRQRLKSELLLGFTAMREAGERPPLPSYYATKIAEIVDRGSEQPIEPNLAYELYQEILLACEEAWEEVTGEKRERSF
jgi:hypothetical protein